MFKRLCSITKLSFFLSLFKQPVGLLSLYLLYLTCNSHAQNISFDHDIFFIPIFLALSGCQDPRRSRLILSSKNIYNKRQQRIPIKLPFSARCAGTSLILAGVFTVLKIALAYRLSSTESLYLSLFFSPFRSDFTIRPTIYISLNSFYVNVDLFFHTGSCRYR